MKFSNTKCGYSSLKNIACNSFGYKKLEECFACFLSFETAMFPKDKCGLFGELDI